MIRFYKEHQGFSIIVGPWGARLAWGSGSFGWRVGDGAWTRFIRRWWTGWHRWDRADW